MNTENRLKLSLNVAVVTGIFCAIVALMLLLNFWQINKRDPLETKAMEQLVERLSQDHNDDSLKADIRNLDLLARKAYFNSWWQVKTGSYLLLGGAILFALALRYYYSLRSKIEIPDQSEEKEWKVRLLSQRWILISGAVIILAALAASYASEDHLNKADILVQAGEDAAQPAATGIEVIEVGGAPSGTDSLQAAIPASADSAGAAAAAAGQTPAAIAFPDAAQVRANAPSFRGPFGNGVYSAQNIPVDFDVASGKNLLWKVTVPLPGYNSPVIWGDKIFLSGANSQKREIYCFNRNSGKLMWTAVADNIQSSPAAPPKVTEDTGLAAPSLATDGNHVYAIFATGDVIALDMTGKRIWAKNLGVPDNHYGHSSSLLVWKDKLYVQFDTNKGRKLIALDALTGNTTWETNRNVKISWASPMLASVNGKYQVILASDPLVAGYDAETGKELWTTNCLSGEVGPSPAFGEGLVFAANEYARLAAINPANGQMVWEQDEYMPEVASPVVSGGLLFVATTYGIMACYDAKSGTKLWEHDGGVGYYASPIVADGKLYAFDMEGKLQVFAVAKEMNLIAESSLGAKVTTTPSFTTGRMYLRAGGSLWCFGAK